MHCLTVICLIVCIAKSLSKLCDKRHDVSKSKGRPLCVDDNRVHGEPFHFVSLIVFENHCLIVAIEDMFNIARRTSTSAYELISGGRKQIADDAEHASPLLSAGESLKNWTSTVSPDVAELQRKGENRPKGVIRRCLQAVCAVIGTGITIALWRYHSELTSIAVFAGGAFMFVSCVLMVWFDFVMAIWRGDPAAHDYVGRSRLTRTLFAGSTLLTVWLLVLLLSPTRTLDVSVPRAGEKYFIGANLYNNEARMPQWTGELVHLIEYREYGLMLTPVLRRCSLNSRAGERVRVDIRVELPRRYIFAPLQIWRGARSPRRRPPHRFRGE